jgi:hypothetical protein
VPGAAVAAGAAKKGWPAARRDPCPDEVCVRAEVRIPLGAVTYNLNSRSSLGRPSREMKMLDIADLLDISLFAVLAIFLGGIGFLSCWEGWQNRRIRKRLRN